MCSPPLPQTCPRCHSAYVAPGATSRADDLTEVCPTCGVEEALRDASGLPRVGVGDWPTGSRGSVPYPQASFDAIAGEYQAMAESVGRSLAPGEDWMPVLLLEGADERRIIGLGDLLSADQPKAFAADVLLPALARATGARLFGLIFTAWLWRAGGGAPTAAASSDPRRVEAVVVSVGDRQRHEVWVAEITRSPDAPPVTAPWARLSSLESPLVDPLRRAMADG